MRSLIILKLYLQGHEKNNENEVDIKDEITRVSLNLFHKNDQKIPKVNKFQLQ